MDAANYRRLQRIFLEALTLPPQQRTRWVSSICGDDPELLQNVNALLTHEAESEQFLQSTAIGDGFHVKKLAALRQHSLNSPAAKHDSIREYD